ncbi:MAG: N-formylglutamate amidohydrolase [Pseudoalteromonadaceae bacterium]|nr:N-formylglutamate amidohydrolase [Pseudoalteromonadaceae bacterium]|tara:strand:- start:5891 stop:6739 length:849 start_codon:yes stop_codon:yes gene_type:complete
MEPAFSLLTPSQTAALPLVFDSPHSGIHCPADFNTLVPVEFIKTGWDAFIDDIWQPVVEQGGYLLHAHFSRMYIDPNRAPTDIDPELLDKPWEICQPTKYSERGMGLIRRFALPNKPMYDRKLTQAEVLHRIHHYYTPYHQQLQTLLDSLHREFNGVWHVDCHSMKSIGNGMNIDAGMSRPDIILGDLDGTSASGEFVDVIAKAFADKGYKVVKNKPYKGGYLVSHYADIAANRHSVQIEINRALYMHEQRFEMNDNYQHFKSDTAYVAQQLASYVSMQIGR